MDNMELEKITPKVVQVIETLQSTPNEWVDLAKTGPLLVATGIQYKAYGYEKLRPFLNEFVDSLEFRCERCEGKPPVYYVRPITEAGQTVQSEESEPEEMPDTQVQCEKFPTEKTWLNKWASIKNDQYKELAELALNENWYYGAEESDNRDYPILRNYLRYTFKRLCHENKVMIRKDLERNEEYAAFNTGLVDKKYEYIYALFKENTRYPTPYWYLVDFVVPGEDAGKTLNKFFNPLPAKADYFENRIENMLYDSSTGKLNVDYTHIIVERTSRLPKDFLEDNCPLSMLTIDGLTLDDIEVSTDDELKRNYFAKLGQAIQANPRIFNRIKNRIDDAKDLAEKRTEWNYKTAIPTYYPKRNTGSLLLPLALTDEEHVDLALVVIRNPSGSYQGETILTLDMAYSNSRLVSRPDSDWLRTEVIAVSDEEDEEE